jgi:hypothetical protein
MKISTFLVSYSVICASVLGVNLTGRAAESKLMPATLSQTILSQNSAPAASPSAPAEVPAGSLDPSSSPKPASSFPMETPTTPSSKSQMNEPTGGAAMTSSNKSANVLVTCGRNGAAYIVSDADSAPVGCHVSKINSPPMSKLIK